MKHSKQLLASISLGLLFLGASYTIVAQSAPAGPTAIFSVTASVSPSCIITNSSGASSLTPLSFGPYNPLDTNAKFGTTSFSIKCIAGTVAKIGLNQGENGAAATTGSCSTGGPGSRCMTNNTTKLAYELYKPTANTPESACGPTIGALTSAGLWGNTSTNQLTLEPAPTGTTIPMRTYNICGYLPAGQNVAAGTGGATATYNDTVTLSVSY